MAQKKVYDEEFKIQAVKRGREIGFSKAAKEPGVNTALFSPRAVGSQQNLRMRFIAIKTDGGAVKGKIAFYCAALKVTMQGFYLHLARRNIPWK